jgi:plasmid stabilization system protein ParE
VERPVKVYWSAAALTDLDRFAAFLQHNHPSLAEVVAAEIVAKARTLEAHPKLGRVLAGKGPYRQIVLRVLNGAYVFRYRVSNERLVILRVFHARERR